MHQPSSPKCGSETPETEKVPVLLVKRIREAILDEVFQPGDRLVEVDLAEGRKKNEVITVEGIDRLQRFSWNLAGYYGQIVARRMRHFYASKRRHPTLEMKPRNSVDTELERRNARPANLLKPNRKSLFGISVKISRSSETLERQKKT
jgi:hypothetical protein